MGDVMIGTRHEYHPLEHELGLPEPASADPNGPMTGSRAPVSNSKRISIRFKTRLLFSRSLPSKGTVRTGQEEIDVPLTICQQTERAYCAIGRWEFLTRPASAPPPARRRWARPSRRR